MHRVALVLILPVLILGLLVIVIRYVWSAVFDVRKAWRIALGIDDADNIALNGRLGQSISSRAAFACKAHRTWGCLLCSLLDDVNPGHCARALVDKDQNL
ncbi:MAG: hypothetical protein KGI82_00300 [Betaproteobacteria bacterium]|nr:hypothetical protein [Betaproteobacteria bacterium]